MNHIVEIDWDKVTDENLKEGLRRLLQLTSAHGHSDTQRPIIFSIDLVDLDCLERLQACPSYMRVRPS